MTTISIQGSCVLRDAIEFNDIGKKIKVEKFVQFINPLTMFGAKIIIEKDIFKEGYLEGNNFSKRCMQLDFNKTLFEWMAEVKSEYLLLDVCDIVKHIFSLDNDILFTESLFFLTNEEKVLSSLNISKSYLYEHKKTMFDISINEYKKCFQSYAAEVLKLYKPSRVILNECYMAEEYINLVDGTPTTYYSNMTPTHLQNCILRAVFEILRDQLGGCHIIKWPDHVYGKEDHKRGKYQLHFQDEYYTYIYHQINEIITKGLG